MDWKKLLILLGFYQLDQSVARTCENSDDISCNNGKCFNVSKRCDDIKDCDDSSDELDCDLYFCKGPNYFRCENNRCISALFLCDDENDCSDFSDEKNCMTHKPDCPVQNAKCEKNKLCALHNCSHDCAQTSSGPRCMCPKGFHLVTEKQCEDINECATYGICDQKCKNLIGSYECFCDKGYSLQNDSKTCKVNAGEAVMIFSSKQKIRTLFLTSKLHYLVAKNLKWAIGVSFDGYCIYWTDINSEKPAIFNACEDGSNRELLVQSGIDTPEDLVIDWITDNIYFTDVGMKFIGVCSNDGFKCAVINRDVDKPRGIVLNQHAGEMFWSDWGNTPQIAKSSMDGSNKISFVSNNINWPNGLALDYPNQRLYWVDAYLGTIESILLKGTDRKVILKELQHPYGIAIFEDKIYWSDWETHSIQYCDKFRGENRHTLFQNKDEIIYDIDIFHSARQQKINNPCKEALCSDICLLNKHSYTCVCPQNKILSSDKHNCRSRHTASNSTVVPTYHSIEQNEYSGSIRSFPALTLFGFVSVFIIIQ